MNSITKNACMHVLCAEYFYMHFEDILGDRKINVAESKLMSVHQSYRQIMISLNSDNLGREHMTGFRMPVT